MRYLLGFLVIILIIGKTDPLCAQWIQTNGPYGGSMVALITRGGETFASNKSGLFRSTDYGASWTRCFVASGPNDLRS